MVGAAVEDQGRPADLAFDVQRYTVTSSVFAPLTVDALDWCGALRLVLELLERAAQYEALEYAIAPNGLVTATHTPSGDRYVVPTRLGSWRQR